MEREKRLRELGVRIRSAREERQLSQTTLGRQVGKSKQLVSAWEAGRAEITLGTLIDVASTLSVPLELLLIGEAAGISGLLMPMGSAVPFLTAAEVLQLAHDGSKVALSNRRLQVHKAMPSNAFAIENPDTSMQGPGYDFAAGEILVFNPELEVHPGDLVCAVALAEGGQKLLQPLLLFRRLRPLTTMIGQAPYLLVPDNPNWPSFAVNKERDAVLLGRLAVTMRER